MASVIKRFEITAINKDTAYEILGKGDKFINAVLKDPSRFINIDSFTKNINTDEVKKSMFYKVWDYITKVIGNDKYNYIILQWYLGTKNKPKSLQRLEDLGRVKDALDRKERFKALINSDPTLIKYRDLNQITFKDLEDLNDILKSRQSGKEEKAGYEEDLVKSGQVEILLNNDEWKVVIPRSEEAAKFYGRNTRWCTSSENNNMYLDYAKKGDLIILIHKKDNKRFQLHFELDQYMNSIDDELNDEEIALIKPVVKSLLPKFKNVSFGGRLMFNEESVTEEEKLEAVKQDSYSIQYIKNPSEKVQLEAVKQDGHSIRYIENPSEKVQLEAARQYGPNIRYITNPSEKVQLEAVKQNGNSIRYIENPSETLQLKAVKQYGPNIRYITNPSEKVQLEAVKQNGDSIDYIKNPSEAVKDYVNSKRKSTLSHFVEAAKFSKPITMFHGTSSKFLRSILKNGLTTNIKNLEGMWQGKDEDASESMRSRKSYGGVYFTTNLIIASSAAGNVSKKTNSNRLYVICQIQPQTTIPDEDNYKHKLPSLRQNMDNEYYLIQERLGLPVGYHFKEKFKGLIDKLIERFVTNINIRQDKEQLYSLAKEVILTEIERQNAYSSMRNKGVTKVKEWDSSEYDLRKVLDRALYAKGGFKYSQPIPRPLRSSSIERAESRARIALDLFIKKTKENRVGNTSKEKFNPTSEGRVLDTVSFSGANKIICIVEEVIMYSVTQKLLVHYGVIPSYFIKQWTHFMGELPKIEIVKR